MPLITGYLAAGFLAGPDILGIVTRSTIDQLGFVNQIALAVIALAAGNELVIKEIRSQFRSIGWVTACLVVTTFSLGAITMYILSGWLPVMMDLDVAVRVAMADAVRRKAGSGLEAPQTAVIFGRTAGAPMMLANQLLARGCQVTLVQLGDVTETKTETKTEPRDTGVSIAKISEISEATLETIELQTADVVIGLMSDDDNLALCQLNHDRFGVEKVVVRFTEKIGEGRQWHQRGAIVLDPKTTLVTLLEHFVTSPTATSILLGMDPEQDVVEVIVADTRLVGIPIRDLKLPLEALILSITRDGHTLISHGYTELQLGDLLTVVGPPEVLPETVLYFER